MPLIGFVVVGPKMLKATKPGFGLFVWNEGRGEWRALMRSEVRSRCERLIPWLEWSLHVQGRVAVARSVEPDDIVEAGLTLRAPHGASFVDPAPEGVFRDDPMFLELDELIWLEVEFQFYFAASPFAKSRSKAVRDALRWAFAQSVLDARERVEADEAELAFSNFGGSTAVAH